MKKISKMIKKVKMKMMKWKMKMNAALCSVDDNSNQSNTINFDIDKEFIIYHQTLEEDFSKY